MCCNVVCDDLTGHLEKGPIPTSWKRIVYTMTDKSIPLPCLHTGTSTLQLKLHLTGQVAVSIWAKSVKCRPCEEENTHQHFHNTAARVARMVSCDVNKQLALNGHGLLAWTSKHQHGLNSSEGSSISQLVVRAARIFAAAGNCFWQQIAHTTLN